MNVDPATPESTRETERKAALSPVFVRLENQKCSVEDEQFVRFSAMTRLRLSVIVTVV